MENETVKKEEKIRVHAAAKKIGISGNQFLFAVKLLNIVEDASKLKLQSTITADVVTTVGNLNHELISKQFSIEKEKKPVVDYRTQYENGGPLYIANKHKDDSLVYRPVLKENVDRYEEMGYVIDVDVNNRIQHSRHSALKDGSPLDSTWQRRNHILMHIPREHYQARQKAKQDERKSIIGRKNTDLKAEGLIGNIKDEPLV